MLFLNINKKVLNKQWYITLFVDANTDKDLFVDANTDRDLFVEGFNFKCVGVIFHQLVKTNFDENYGNGGLLF